ncbi:TetR/AcrR family transcriptional regulator [Parapusillimonas sp. SGNA-6]|nr:TetR/AcrR family transcriptional regulator [Parapusillimonas sp. SGNA-6]
MEPHKQARRAELAAHRRSAILEAAKAVFQEAGLEGANIREIARRAGYTPGALYFHFRNKEEIYGDLLAESLERLNDAVRSAGGNARTLRGRLVAKAMAFFNFYLDHPRDLDLGFYLFHGMKPQGLTPELNARLNQRLQDALIPVRSLLREAGLGASQAQREMTALFGHCVGLLLLQHTGRIRLFGQHPAALYKQYVEQLYQRVQAGTR